MLTLTLIPGLLAVAAITFLARKRERKSMPRISFGARLRASPPETIPVTCRLPPTPEINHTGIEENRSVTQFGRAEKVRVVGFCAAAARAGVDFAADVSPIRFRVAVPIQHRKHEVDETDVACLWLDLETGDQMPAKLRLGWGGVWRLPPTVGGSCATRCRVSRY